MIFLKRKLFISAFVLQGVSSVLKQIVGNITGRIVDYLAQVVENTEASCKSTGTFKIAVSKN